MKTLLALAALLAVASGEDNLVTVNTSAGPVKAIESTYTPPPLREGQQPIYWVVLTQKTDGIEVQDGLGGRLNGELGDVMPLIAVRDTASLGPELRAEFAGIEKLAWVRFGEDTMLIPAKTVAFVPATQVPAALAQTYESDVAAYVKQRAQFLAEEARAEAGDRRAEKRAERERKKQRAAADGARWLQAQQAISELQRIRGVLDKR